MSSSPTAYNFAHETRKVERVPILVPASMQVNGRESPVRVVNITQYGAQFETAASVASRSRLTLRCGGIVAEAVVIWTMTGRVGVRFLQDQSCSDVARQIARHDAMRSRNMAL